MNITINTSRGNGSTELSAFDNALYNAGVSNYNLIPLSSVIPPKSHILINKPFESREDEFGNKLYCVLSQSRTSIPGEEIWSGIGWVQAKDGRGLFVEHHAKSENELNILIDKSLQSMIKYRVMPFGGVNRLTIGVKCIDQPVCSLAIATYQSQGW